MAETTSKTARLYVVSCLEMNPLWQTDIILAARSNTLGVEQKQNVSHTEAQALAAEKTELRSKLQTLRENVWTGPLPKLKARLDSLSLDNHPDLKPLSDRLRTIIQVRVRLPELTQHAHFDGDFFTCFKQALSGTPRESAQMRERVWSSFAQRRLRKRGRRMIKLLRRETPELCALETSWLNSLERQKPQSGLIGQARESSPAMDVNGGLTAGKWYWWVLALILIQILATLSRVNGDG